MNAEVNGVAHVGAAVEIADGLCGEDTVRVGDLLVIVSQENCRQNVHLFDDHLTKRFEGNG